MGSEIFGKVFVDKNALCVTASKEKVLDQCDSQTDCFDRGVQAAAQRLDTLGVGRSDA